jgi:hypothetical protein
MGGSNYFTRCVKLSNNEIKEPIDLEKEFETIQTLKQEMANELLDIEKAISELLETRSAIAEPYENEIKFCEENIRNEVLDRGKSFKCSVGKATYNKGRTTIKWNDEALKGYAVEHEAILQFRSESKGEAYVSVSAGEQK